MICSHKIYHDHKYDMSFIFISIQYWSRLWYRVYAMNPDFYKKFIWNPPRSCKKILMVRIKTEVLMFLIVFDLLFQIQEKSRRSISKKVRITRFLKIVKLDQPGVFAYIFLFTLELFSHWRFWVIEILIADWRGHNHLPNWSSLIGSEQWLKIFNVKRALSSWWRS